jgi:hypothetical protein
VEIRVNVPDEFASSLVRPGGDPSRTALEAFGLEAYRQRRLTASQLRRLLGIESRFELDAFLKEHEVFDYTMEDFEHDMANLEALGLKTPRPPL